MGAAVQPLLAEKGGRWEQPNMAADKDKWGDEGGLGHGVLGLEGAKTG